MTQIRPVRPDDLSTVSQFLHQHPLRDAALSATFQLTHPAPPEGMFVAETDARIDGLIYVASTFHLAASDDVALPWETIIGHQESIQLPKWILVPSHHAETYLAAFEAHLGHAPVWVAAKQPVWVFRQRDWHEGRRLPCQLASLQDLDDVAAASNAMMIEHGNYSPLTDSQRQFLTMWRARIRRGGVFLARSRRGELIFMADAGMASHDVIQIQSVYVPQHWRGRGLARLGMRHVMRWALGQRRQLVLWFHPDNLAAAALYRRLGFTDTGYRLTQARFADW